MSPAPPIVSREVCQMLRFGLCCDKFGKVYKRQKEWTRGVQLCIIRTGKLSRATVGAARFEGGSFIVDTTVKSAPKGYKLLAPSWTIVSGYKAGRIAAEEYTEMYLLMLRVRWSVGLKDLIAQLLQYEDITLMCYCDSGAFCHRHILADVIAQCAEQWGVPCEIEAGRN